MPVLLGAEVALGFHRLPALRTDWPAAVGDLRAPDGQMAGLLAVAPEAHHRGFFRVIAFEMSSLTARMLPPQQSFLPL